MQPGLRLAELGGNSLKVVAWQWAACAKAQWWEDCWGTRVKEESSEAGKEVVKRGQTWPV